MPWRDSNGWTDGSRAIYRSSSDRSEGARRSAGAPRRRLKGPRSMLLRCRSGLYSEGVPVLLRSLLMNFAPQAPLHLSPAFPSVLQDLSILDVAYWHPNFLYRTSTRPETSVSLVDAHSFHPWSSLLSSPRVPTTPRLQRIYPAFTHATGQLGSGLLAVARRIDA
jgi:hypothetical protein